MFFAIFLLLPGMKIIIPNLTSRHQWRWYERLCTWWDRQSTHTYNKTPLNRVKAKAPFCFLSHEERNYPLGLFDKETMSDRALEQYRASLLKWAIQYRVCVWLFYLPHHTDITCITAHITHNNNADPWIHITKSKDATHVILVTIGIDPRRARLLEPLTVAARVCLIWCKREKAMSNYEKTQQKKGTQITFTTGKRMHMKYRNQNISYL